MIVSLLLFTLKEHSRLVNIHAPQLATCHIHGNAKSTKLENKIP
jgi:hypothetical protein